jgi:hypothetical protein
MEALGLAGIFHIKTIKINHKLKPIGVVGNWKLKTEVCHCKKFTSFSNIFFDFSRDMTKMIPKMKRASI